MVYGAAVLPINFSDLKMQFQSLETSPALYRKPSASHYISSVAFELKDC